MWHVCVVCVLLFGDMTSVIGIEVVGISECPLSEVPLYWFAHRQDVITILYLIMETCYVFALSNIWKQSKDIASILSNLAHYTQT